MLLPEYVTKQEVQRVCSELGIRDWTDLPEANILPSEAEIIMNDVIAGSMDIPVEDFLQGLEVELEHGLRFMDANVTNNHPILTGRIVLAHLKETVDYYKRLEVAELEGDLLKAIKAKDSIKIQGKYTKLVAAMSVLNQSVLDELLQ